MYTNQSDIRTQPPIDDLNTLLTELEHYRRLMSALRRIWPELAGVLERVLEDEPAT